MDELKKALEGLLFIIDEFIPDDCFKNGVEHQGIDEGEVICGRVIEGARYILSMHMTESERQNSSAFPYGVATQKDLPAKNGVKEMIEVKRQRVFADYNIRVHNCNIEVMAGLIYPEDKISINISATGSLTPDQAREFVKAVGLAIDLAEGKIAIQHSGKSP